MFDLGALLGITQFHRLMARRAGSLRKTITALMGRSLPSDPRRFLRYAWRLLPAARQALYKQRRMSAELPNSLLYLNHHGAGAIKTQNSDGTEGMLSAGLESYFSRTAKFTCATLDDLVSTLRDTTDAGNMAVNYRIQRNVTVIAVVALVAAVLALDFDKLATWIVTAVSAWRLWMR
jgi:hypothetical protein